MMAFAPTVLDFWFLPAASGGTPRPEWFRKDEQFDQEIRARFGGLIKQALAGGLLDWDQAGAHGSLARILLLDQFTRNAYRGTPDAFAGDALALRAAQNLVGSGMDFALPPLPRAFAYMPFEHAEDEALQDQAVALFTQLCNMAPGFENMLDFANRHRDIIVRFGRFPHRNEILGRASTPEEQEFLRQSGAGF